MARRQRHSLGLLPADHMRAADVLIGSARGFISAAEEAYKKGACARAGAEIDGAYFTLGVASGHTHGAGRGPTAAYLKAYARLKMLDEKFENNCVKKRPT